MAGRQREQVEPAMSNLDELTARALADIAASTDLAALDELRVRLLGKKGSLTEQLKLTRRTARERPSGGGRGDQREQGKCPGRHRGAA